MGALVMGDWQAIGNDPCPSAAKASFALTNASSSGEWQADDYTNMESGMIPPEASAIGSGESGIDPTHLLTLTLEMVGEENITSNLILHNKLLRSNCKALSIPNHQCFWNPTSRITGEECNTCRPACLSKQRSLTIYQITIGASLLALAAPLGFVFVAVVTSGYGSLKHQVLNVLYIHKYYNCQYDCGKWLNVLQDKRYKEILMLYSPQSLPVIAAFFSVLKYIKSCKSREHTNIIPY